MGRLTPLAVVGFPLLALFFACGDELNSFQFLNSTGSTLDITYRIQGEGSDAVLGSNEYSVPAGATVDTQQDKSKSGGYGSDPFVGGQTLRLTAESGGQTVYDKTFTYNELRNMNWRVLISDADLSTVH